MTLRTLVISASRRIVARFFPLAGAFAARALAGLGPVALGVTAARLAGPEGLGQLAVALALAMLAVLVARHGLDLCLVRAVAGRLAEGRPDALPGFLWEALRGAGVAALAIMAGAVSGLWLWGWLALPGLPGGAALPVLVLAIPPLALTGMVAGYLKGRRRVARAALVEIGGLSLATAAVLWGLDALGAAPGVAAIAGVLVALAWLTAAGAVAWALADAARLAGQPVRLARPDPAVRAGLMRGRFDFLTIAVAGFLTQAGVFVLLGPFLGDAELGLARAAERLALLAGFPLIALDPFIMPRIAAHAARARGAALDRLMRRACLASGLMALPVAAVLIAVPEDVLALFGPGFAGAAPVLRILACAQLAVAVVGPFSAYLSMTGRERTLRRIHLGALAAGLVAVPLGAVSHGAAGFALAYAAVNAGRALAMAWAARRAPPV